MIAQIPNLSLFWITFLGGIFAYYFQKKSDISIKLFLSFSGAFLLATCVMHLLPELFENQELKVAPFILLGFFLQILIEYFSQGVEHGHIHKPHEKQGFPFLIYLGLCLHAFAEGMPLSSADWQSAFFPPLFWGILLHKVPIVFILVSLLMAYQVKTKNLFAAVIVFALMAPMGGMLGSFIADHTSTDYLIYFLAASTGIFLHISTVILFETSHNHRFNFLKFVFIVAGGFLSFLIF